MLYRVLALCALGFVVSCRPGKGGSSSGDPAAATTDSPQNLDPDPSSPTGTITIGSVDAVVLSDADGVMTAQLKLDASNVQVVHASDVALIVGASLEVPPASMTKAAKITMQTGVPVATQAVALAVGLQDAQELKAVGSAVLLEATPSFDAPESAPFTLKLPIPLAASLADAGSYGVMYRVRVAAEGDKVVEGVIPTASIKVEGNLLVVQVRYVGV